MSSCVRVAISSACDFEYARCLCAGGLRAPRGGRVAFFGCPGVNAIASADRFGDAPSTCALPVSCPPNVLPPMDAP